MLFDCWVYQGWKGTVWLIKWYFVLVYYILELISVQNCMVYGLSGVHIISQQLKCLYCKGELVEISSTFICNKNWGWLLDFVIV